MAYLNLQAREQKICLYTTYVRYCMLTCLHAHISRGSKIAFIEPRTMSKSTHFGASLTAPEDRALLCSLTESAQYGPALKSVLDRAWSEDVVSPILQEHVLKKNRDIHAICHSHYQVCMLMFM